MSARSDPSPGNHPIQVAARRSGLSPDVLRVWERRYQAVEPRRTSSNRRAYTDEDVERLFLLGQVTRAGRRIGDVARLSLQELRTMVEADRRLESRVERVPGKGYLPSCLEAVERMDAAALREAIAEASISLAAPALLEQLLVPLLRAIGDRWHSGALRVAHEHMTTAIVRSTLDALKDGGSPGETAPELIVATPAGQRHELGALMAAAVAVADGWRVTYLGADLPAQEIAAAALARNARAVALSIVHPADDPRLAAELRALRAALGDRATLIIGGASAEGYGQVLAEIDAIVQPDIAHLSLELQALRRAPRANAGSPPVYP